MAGLGRRMRSPVGGDDDVEVVQEGRVAHALGAVVLVAAPDRTAASDGQDGGTGQSEATGDEAKGSRRRNSGSAPVACGEGKLTR